MKKYRVINKRRFITFMASLLLISIYMIGYLKTFALDTLADKDSEYIEVIVEKGDILWSIGCSFLPQGEDIRNIVYDLKLINKLEDTNIYEGDIIKIPKNLKSKSLKVAEERKKEVGEGRGSRSKEKK